VIHYMKHNARPLIFSASITPAQAAAALASLDIIETEAHMRTKVLQTAHRVRTGLAQLGYCVAGNEDSPIVPVIIGHQEKMMRLWKTLFECGVFTNAVTAPAVPAGMDLIRTSFMASHTEEQIQQVLDRFAVAGRMCGVIPGGVQSAAAN